MSSNSDPAKPSSSPYRNAILTAALETAQDWWVLLWNKISLIHKHIPVWAVQLGRVVYCKVTYWWTWIRYGKGISGSFRGGGLFLKSSQRSRLLKELRSDSFVKGVSSEAENSHDVNPKHVLRFASLLLSYLSEYVSEGLEPVEEIRRRWQDALERQEHPSLFARLLLPKVLQYPNPTICQQRIEQLEEFSELYFQRMGEIETLHNAVLRVSGNVSKASQEEVFQLLEQTVAMAVELHTFSDEIPDLQKPMPSVDLENIHISSKTNLERFGAIVQSLNAVLGKSYQVPSAALAKRPGLMFHKLRDLWWVNAIMQGTILYFSFRWLHHNSNNFGPWLDSFGDWMQLHLVDPASTILREIFMEEGLHILNQNAISETRTSLQNMVKDYLQARAVPAGWTSQDSVPHMVRDLDMSVLVSQYEKSVQQPLKSLLVGDLAQLGLIQVQVLKHDMQVAMSAVDKIMQENHFNAQLMAMLPAAVVLGLMYSSIGRLYYWIIDDTLSTSLLRLKARLSLSQIERVLRKLDNPQLDNPSAQATMEGRLVFLLLDLDDVISKSNRMTSVPERVDIREALRDCYPRNGKSVQQGLDAVTRLRSVHALFQANLS